MSRSAGSKNVTFLKSGSIVIGGVEYTASIVSRGADGKFPHSDAAIQEKDSLIGKSQSTSWD